MLKNSILSFLVFCLILLFGLTTTNEAAKATPKFKNFKEIELQKNNDYTGIS